ncbi:uncharacterized protein LOC110944601 [Helianthus annuus]|uniref:uncharacterized protein LOC110944601 n=1 Tax=Helianthus annuus TaxID=4232 RepID=UPI000B9083FA|nr:uncharacterized protein LOC110944601 [Helianthus annuus]
MYFQLKDFKPSMWMGDAVINCFATFLNYEEVNGRKPTKGKSKEVYKKIGERRRLFCHTVCFNDNVLCNTKYNDKGRLEKFSSALLMVLNKDASFLKLTGYTIIVFPILENHHFYLVSFDMEKVAISVIDNMRASESILRSFCQLTFGVSFADEISDISSTIFIVNNRALYVMITIFYDNLEFVGFHGTNVSITTFCYKLGGGKI